MTRFRLTWGLELSESSFPFLQKRRLVSAMSTAELGRRPSRMPDHRAENSALVALAQTMAAWPERILQQLSDTALTLCHAHSAGLSLLEDEDNRRVFHWRAISGEWASHRGGRPPRHFGPCGTVLDRNMPLLFSHPERDFPYLAEVSPPLEDALLIPFYIGGEARGTIWIVSHDVDQKFDAEDLRVMTILGNFAGLAYQTVLSVGGSLKSERKLKQSDAAAGRYMAIIESSDDAIFSKSLQGVITSWNPGAGRLFGYTADEAIGKPSEMLIPRNQLNEELDVLTRVRYGEHVEPYETQRAHKDGRPVDISLTVSPIRNALGRVIGASMIARNIAERKRAQERQALLVEEIKHRIRNTLTTVHAIAMQTLRQTPKDERDAFISRLHALSNAHDVLTQENWHRAALFDLVTRTLEPFRLERDDRVSVDGPPVWLDAAKSLLLTLAIHELATNAGKYGALSGTAGRVRITWELQDMAPQCVTLRWQEFDGPAVMPPRHRGFGSKLIETALRSELGKHDLQFLPDGVVCTLKLPL